MVVQTAGVLSEVRDQLGPDCEIAVKVVEAEGDAWPIAAAANYQNPVARIDLRLLATSASSSCSGSCRRPPAATNG